MSIDVSPFEGKIVLLCYTECDYEGDDNACLVYQVESGRLKPLYGVMNLPDGACWNDNNAQYERALLILRYLNVREVYVPQFTAQGVDFFGTKLGHIDLTEELNERGEIEYWCEFGAFDVWEMISLLENAQIKVIEINPDTMEVARQIG